jgi:hypothetical protein
MGSQRDACAHRLDDLGVGVSHHHHAVAVVVVDVLVAVDVPHARAQTAVDVDRVRWPALPRRRDAAGEVGLRQLAVAEAAGVLGVERRHLALRQLLDEADVDLDHAWNPFDVGPGRSHRIRVSS